MDYKLDSNEIEKIEKLIKLTSSIDEIYNKLYNLELEGKHNTNEYIQLLEYLKSLINIEKNLYEDENFTLEKCTLWAKYILSNKVPKNFFDGLEGIMIRDYKNRVYRRILGVLKNKVIYDCNNVTRLIPKDFRNLIKDQTIPNLDKITNYVIQCNINVNKAIEKDTFNAFLLFLQESIDQNKYIHFKSDLIQTKYDTSFIDLNIESDMINCSFQIQDKIYESARFTSDLVQMPLEVLTTIKNSNGSKNAMIQISELIEINDNDYTDKEKNISSILRQCLLRSYLLLLTNDVLDEVNFKFHELIDDKEYLKRHPKDKLSEQFIMECFKGIKKDRTKQNILSFGYRKI